MSTVDWLHKMRAAGFSPEQAEAIANSGSYLMPEYFAARFEGFERRVVRTLTIRWLGIAGCAVLAEWLLDHRFV